MLAYVSRALSKSHKKHYCQNRSSQVLACIDNSDLAVRGMRYIEGTVRVSMRELVRVCERDGGRG